MEKNIVTITKNSKGEEIDRTADYIGVEAFAQAIEKIYRGCLDNFEDSQEFEQYINDLYGDQNYIKTAAWEFAVDANEDMKKYLHMSSHRMDGNFANIEQDYPKYRTGTYWSSEYDGDDYFGLFPEMVKRLDSAEDSERADDDREYLSSWFFFAFGTFGIEYNFSNGLEQIHYDLEEEDAYFAERTA